MQMCEEVFAYGYDESTYVRFNLGFVAGRGDLTWLWKRPVTEADFGLAECKF